MSGLNCSGGGFDVAGKQERIEVVLAESADPTFWDDPTRAQKLTRELNTMQKQVTMWEGLSGRLTDAREIVEFDDDELLSELNDELTSLTDEIDTLEFETLFSHEHDSKPAIFSIFAGAGGTEAQDWAEMLQRMFLRFWEQHGFKVDEMDYTAGDVAGLKSVTYSVTGDHPYGWLKSEDGVHRLVRLSPFNAAGKRQTSFAKVEVYPDIAEEIDIQIDQKDLEKQRFKASGAGGQHVQKNETAIRIRHIPSGIVVSCQNQRSLMQNEESAMKVLKVRLYELEQEKQQEALSDLKGDNIDAGWGNQIRNYVLHPYKMVKDLRTRHETSNPTKVLDGALDPFVEAYLRYILGEKENDLT